MAYIPSLSIAPSSASCTACGRAGPTSRWSKLSRVRPASSTRAPLRNDRMRLNAGGGCPWRQLCSGSRLKLLTGAVACMGQEVLLRTRNLAASATEAMLWINIEAYASHSFGHSDNEHILADQAKHLLALTLVVCSKLGASSMSSLSAAAKADRSLGRLVT